MQEDDEVDCSWGEITEEVEDAEDVEEDVEDVEVDVDDDEDKLK